MRSASARLCLLALLSLPSPALAQSEDCSILGMNAHVRDTLDEYYFWYRELPDTDPALYGSPEAYLDAVRFRPIDNAFSYIADRAATEAFFSSSQTVGIGMSYGQLDPGELRVLQVFPGSAGGDAGLRRGDYLEAIDGRPVADLLRTGEVALALGPSTPGYTLSLSWRSPDGEASTATIVKRAYTIPTVSHTAVIDNDGIPVGYVHLRNFVEPSIEALDRAFSEFRERGVIDIVLDVRYNGGGLVDVATHLAGLIGGFRTNTKVFVEFVHNDKQSSLNQSVRFEDPAASVDAPRVAIITSRSSASASELVANGLDPFIPVTLVGRRTYGKPVGQYGFSFCDRVLFPVAFQLVNADGDGDYFDGLPVDCPMRDGVNRALGDPREARLAEALYFLRNGRCSPESAMAARMQRTDDDVTIESSGFELLVNAK